MCGRGVFPWVSCAPPQGADRPSTPQFWGSLLFMHTPFDAERPSLTWAGLLILPYNIAILSIANIVFSIAKVLQYFLKICIGIGIANTFSSIGKPDFYQYQYRYHLEHTITQQNCGYVWYSSKVVVLICLYCLKCTKFGRMILRKIINIVATRCQILRI